MNDVIITLIIFILTIINFILGYFSMGVTALISMMALVFTGVITGGEALSGFANSNTIVMVSMFIVSAGLNKTQLVPKLSKLVNRVSGGSFFKVLSGYVLVTALLAQFIPSAMAVFSIVFPIVIGMCEELKISPSKMLFSIGITAIGTVNTLPIGSGAAMYAQFNGMLEAYEYTAYQFGFFDNLIARAPILAIIVLYAIFIAPRFAPDKPVIDIKSENRGNAKKEDMVKLDSTREVLGYIIFIGVILGLAFQSVIGIPIWQISFTGAVLMVATGILSSAEAYTAASLGGMAVLYVGVLALGNALTSTGAGQVIGNFIANMLGGTTNGYIIGFVFFLVPFLLTQVMMNVSVMNVFHPIAIMVCKSLEISPIGPMLLVLIACLTAFITPLATPTVPMMMGLGGYDQKTMLKMSWLPGTIICIASVLWVMTVFPV